MRFSEKYGFKRLKTAIQTDSIDSDLRNALWSALEISFWRTIRPTNFVTHVEYTLADHQNQEMEILCTHIWINFFKQPIDTLSSDWEKVFEQLRDYFFKCDWYEVYDFIEFISQNYPIKTITDSFIQRCNFYLEREVSAYRFVGSRITPIVSDEEITAIEDALKSDRDPVREHLNCALQMLADRKNPDYRNSIKEAISAVEALARSIIGTEKGTLGQLLNKMEKNNGLHPSLKNAFTNFYGYTSDAKGIRHALMDGDSVTFEEAKFMLVACSAFVNYVSSQLGSNLAP